MRDTKLLWHARVLRVAGWNALLLAAGLAIVMLVGEAWFRLTIPFVWGYRREVFVPGVGPLFHPNAETRSTNRLDFWVTSRSNRLGFLDRNPPRPQRAAESCHIAVIGDSFVEAHEVPIREKFHVLLEEMAAKDLPSLDITTSAFGMSGTGQIEQLPYYDEYARHLRPRLIVLVFVPNDYVDNFALWRALWRGGHPQHLRRVSAARTDDGGFRLHPPDPNHLRFLLQLNQPQGPQGALRSLLVEDGNMGRAIRASYFRAWLHTKIGHLSLDEDEANIYTIRLKRAKLLSRNPAYARLLDGWRPVSRGIARVRSPGEKEGVPSFFALFREGNNSPFYQEALAFTAFALDQFKERAERDGAALVILATHRLYYFGGGTFARLSELAAQRGIPVVDQGEYIHRQGARLRDAGWAHDDHWNAKGHRWAAGALLEYLKRNQDVCG